MDFTNTRYFSRCNRTFKNDVLFRLDGGQCIDLAQCVKPPDANKWNYFQHPSIGGGYSGTIKWARVLTQALGGSQGASLCLLVGPSVCHRLANG